VRSIANSDKVACSNILEYLCVDCCRGNFAYGHPKVSGIYLAASNMEDVLIVGGPVEKTSVSLCLYGEDLNPDEISGVLSCQPTRAHRRGDLKHHNLRFAPYRTGMWSLNLKGFAPITAAELIQGLLSRVSTDAQVWQELSAAYEVQLRIAPHMETWNTEFYLHPQTIQRISELGAIVVFDIYAHGENCLSRRRLARCHHPRSTQLKLKP
jgi:Domain of unknown function (DUF4279)